MPTSYPHIPRALISLLLAGPALAAPGDWEAQAAALRQSGECAKALSLVVAQLPPLEPASPEADVLLATQGVGFLRDRCDAESLILHEKLLAVRLDLFGPTGKLVGNALSNLGLLHTRLDDLDAAREELSAAIEIHRAARGETHPLVAQSLGHLGYAELQAGELDEALALFERALAIDSDQASPRVLALRTSDVGGVLKRLGRFAEAATMFERARAYRASLDPPQPLLVATSDHELGRLLLSAGRASEAIGPLERAATTMRDLLPASHPFVSSTLDTLGEALRAAGQLDSARPLLAERLRLEQSHRPGQAGEAAAWLGLALLEVDEAHDEQARQAYQRSIALWEQLPERHADLSSALQGLGGVQLRHQELEAAERTLNRAVELLKAMPDQSARLVGVLKSLAFLSADRGRFDQALGLHQRAVSLASTLSEDVLLQANAQSGLGGVLLWLGDLSGAQLTLQAARDGYVQLGAEGSPEHSSVLNNLANIASLQRRPEEALELHRAVERAQQTRYGAIHPRTLQARINVASTLVRLGRAESALPILHTVLEQASAEQHPEHYAAALSTLAQIKLDAGELDTAEQHWLAARAILESRFGGTNPQLTATLTGLGRIVEQRGDGTTSLALARQALEAHEQVLDQVWDLPDQEALALSAQAHQVFSRWLHARRHHSDLDGTWTRLRHWKGVATRATRARTRALRDNTERQEALTAARRRLARAASSGAIASLAQLQGEVRELEQGLALTDKQPKEPSRTEICRALGRRGALVDIARYAAPAGTPGYLAFVLRGRDCTLELVDLGPAGPLEIEATGWVRALADPTTYRSRADIRGLRVTELAWTPLADAIGAADRIWLSPDGIYATLPLPALPLPTGGYLLESVTSSMVQDLGAIGRHRSTPVRGLLAIGDVDYADPQQADRSCQAKRDWAPLPGSYAELEAVVGAWREAGGEAARLTGTSADEASVALKSAGRQVLHMATHGFSGLQGCEPSVAASLHPMLTSGIALANVNSGGDAAGDGVLTAAEVAGLPLQDTELVVLAACQSALGQAQAGEGVLGLRRGFAVAGVRNLVMSLWSVPDQTTASFMEDLYGTLLRRGRLTDPAAALREVQLHRLDADRAQPGAAPFVGWAGWVVGQ